MNIRYQATTGMIAVQATAPCTMVTPWASAAPPAHHDNRKHPLEAFS